MTNTDLRTHLTEIASSVRPVDLHERSLRRAAQLRRNRTVATSVGAAVATVAVAGLVWQLLPGVGTGPMPPAQTTSPSPTATSAPTVEPTPTAETLPTDLPPVPSLSDATLEIPQWPAFSPELGSCASGVLTFSDGEYNGPTGSVRLGYSVAFWVPGEAHIVASVACGGQFEGTAAEQVLAYRADGSGGYDLVASVLDTGPLIPEEVSEANITGLAPGIASVTVDIRGERNGGSDPSGEDILNHRRTYSWDGSAYVQTAGPTSFRADPDLAVTTTNLVFGPANGDGCRTGTVTVTLANNGSVPVADLVVILQVRGLDSAADEFSSCDNPDVQYGDHARVGTTPLAPGESRSLNITVVQNPIYAGLYPSGATYAFTTEVQAGLAWTDVSTQTTARYQ